MFSCVEKQSLIITRVRFCLPFLYSNCLLLRPTQKNVWLSFTDRPKSFLFILFFMCSLKTLKLSMKSQTNKRKVLFSGKANSETSYKGKLTCVVHHAANPASGECIWLPLNRRVQRGLDSTRIETNNLPNYL